MRSIVPAVLMALLASPALAGTHVARCGRLLDVRTGRVSQNQVVMFDDRGIIDFVGPAASATIAADAEQLDLSGFFCLPGLIDVHTHMNSNPGDTGYDGLAISPPRAAIFGARNARLTLQAGFTTVRNLGEMGFSDVAVRDGILAGDIEGPDMLVSGPALGITGGHTDNNLLPFEYHYRFEGVADGPWAARAKVREVIKYGADVIKVMASGGVFSKGDAPGTAQYTLEELQAIVDEAHKLGRKVAMHAHGLQSIKDAIRAGADSVEHATYIDDATIELAKSRGTWLVFDIYNDDYILAQGKTDGSLQESLDKEAQIGRIQRENFRRAQRAGAKIAYGTDAGVYPHGGNARQLAKMVEWGMTPLQAIQTATLNAADLLGRADRLGVLEPGHRADLIAVREDPVRNVAVLEHVDFVMKAGVVFKGRPGT